MPKKQKGNKGKKAQEKAEELALLLQLQREQYLIDTKERVAREWELNKLKAKTFKEEHEVRAAQLKISLKKLHDIDRKWWEYKDYVWKMKTWNQYLKCDRLPDPSSFSEMNTYMYVWTELESNETVPYCRHKATEVMELIKGLDKEIIDPGPSCSPSHIRDWKKIRQDFRDMLQHQLDMTAYRIFRKVETDMKPIDITLTKYITRGTYFTMSLLAEYMMPVPSSRANEVRQPLPVTFDEVNVKMVIPPQLSDVQKTMRAMWLSYDHWSDRCPSYDCPPFPAYYTKDLLELVEEEMQSKVEELDHRNILELKVKKLIARIPPDHTISQELLVWDSEPQRVLSEEISVQQIELEIAWTQQAKKKLNPFEVNLRENLFIGGVLFLDIHYEPLQPKYLRYKFDVTLLPEAPVLHPVNYYVKYPPPPPPIMFDDDGNEIPSLPIDLEKVKQELVKVDLILPTAALWLELPKPAIWDPRFNYWSVEDVHDIHYDGEEKIFSFSAGRLGLFGFFIPRYCNFMYRHWELSPDGEGGAVFRLTTPKVELEFKVREHQVCLFDLINSPTDDLNWILGIYYTPIELMQALKKGGIDVFPPPDAPCYIPEAVPKNVVLENHVYQIWGLFCLSFRFQFSRFNYQAGRRQIIFQMKEHHPEHETEYCLIRSSPGDTCILDINEGSEEFSSEAVPESPFYADLYNLIMDNCTSAAKRNTDATSFLLTQTVRDLLAFIRPLSYC